jgi:DNA polymerase III alpha subunit
MQYKGRSTDEWGNVLFDADGLIDRLMRNSELHDLKAVPSRGVVLYNQLCKQLDHPQDAVEIYQEPTCTVEESDAEHQSQWLTPEPYSSMDVLDYLLNKCTTEQQVQRVLDEWQMFLDRDMVPVLKLLIYLVADFRERNIVWGVGRGSSVASYSLFLIGIHKVDSLKYDLDVGEFLK